MTTVGVAAGFTGAAWPAVALAAPGFSGNICGVKNSIPINPTGRHRQEATMRPLFASWVSPVSPALLHIAGLCYGAAEVLPPGNWSLICSRWKTSPHTTTTLRVIEAVAVLSSAWQVVRSSSLLGVQLLIPGVLKNAIDWVSRPPKTCPFRKPLGIIGASSGGIQNGATGPSGV